MAVDKKTIAYVLIGVAVAGGAYYFYTKNKGNAASLGTGTADMRGAWGADDDAVYNAMRSKFSASYNSDLGWVDPLVKARYEGTDGIAADPTRKRSIKGIQSKAGAFLSVFEEVNPNNEKGRFMAGTSTPATPLMRASSLQLWPETLHVELWNMYNNFQIKHGAL